MGREPRLSIAEIISYFNLQKIVYQILDLQSDFCVFATEQNLATNKIMMELGGTIKIAGIIGEEKNKFKSSLDFKEALVKIIIKKLQAEQKNRKIFFGLSFYNTKNSRFAFNKKLSLSLGLEIKKGLEKNNINSRLVTSRDIALSSVTVKLNKLLSQRGAEIIYANGKEKIWLAKTLAVQPFEEFGERDFGRPERDARSGMIPPKLAKIMINLAKTPKTEAILDPFCGSGTIISEAAIMEYQKISGSDISAAAISNTRKNIIWLKEKYNINIQSINIEQCDATKLHTCFPKNSVAAIITEPFLGPPLKIKEKPELIKKIIAYLTELYSKVLQQFSEILKPGGTIVMIFPIIHGENYLPLEKIITGLPLTISPLLPIEFQNKLTQRQTLVYARPEQRVKREIVRFMKKELG